MTATVLQMVYVVVDNFDRGMNNACFALQFGSERLDVLSDVAQREAVLVSSRGASLS